jgi:CRP-like cAMP-binding protein
MMETIAIRPSFKLNKTSEKDASGSEILDYISNFSDLNPAETKAILSSIKIRNFKKGAILLKAGQFANNCYFVLKGCVRQYYLIDGEEKTINFFTEGQPVSINNEGKLNKTPAKFYLSCLEDCTLTVGTPEDEALLFQKFPLFESICRLAVEDQLGKSQDSFAAFMTKSPEERYLNLLEMRPELLDRVPQYHLASFLGVTPESLSRIRKRIMAR